ncbi:MAG: hypothetical protein H0V64_11565 [Geodermatophilaceae bacterium]|nr:hypothetical protein [Geodermatophilaceae bacterium]MDQ3463152.1 hypothetical protein [Actinomycetota bacterium]
MTFPVVLLGPQRTPTLDMVVQSMDLNGRFATITAGWLEREPDDEELDDQLDGRGVNLSLYARWLDVQERDPEFAAAERRLRAVLDEVQELYLLRLDHGLAAVHDVRRGGEPGPLHAAAVTEAIDAVRALDEQHLARINDVHNEFYELWPPHERPVIAHHRAEVARLLEDAAALIVTGGHVGVLVNAMHLFNVSASLGTPVIAWSAGAMALTDRIVLFHDRSVRGPSNPEVYGRGLSLLRDVVPLPHASARLLLEDADRMSVFARRFVPARCVLLEAGTRVDTGSGGSCPVGTRVLAEDGRVAVLEAASA